MNSLIKCKRVYKMKKRELVPLPSERPVTRNVLHLFFRGGSGLNKNSQTSRNSCAATSYFGIFRATLGSIDLLLLDGENNRDIGNIQYLINCIFDAKSQASPFTLARRNGEPR